MKKGDRNLLIYLDGTEESIFAIKKGIQIAKINDGKVFTIFLINTEILNRLTITGIFVKDEAEDFRSSLKENAKKYSSLAKNLAISKKVKIETIIEEGSLTDVISSIIKKFDIDLFIMGLKYVGHKSTMAPDKKRLIEELDIDILIVKKFDEQLWRKI